MVDPSLAHPMTARSFLILKSSQLTRTFLLDSVSVFLISTAETKGKPRNMKLVRKERHMVICDINTLPAMVGVTIHFFNCVVPSQ